MKKGFVFIIILLIVLSISYFLISNSINTNSTSNVKNIDDNNKVNVGDIEIIAEGFSGADGIVVDYNRNIFVGNRHNNVISIIDKNGEVNDFVKLNCRELLCMTIDKNNNIYAAGKDKLFKISKDGEVIEISSDFTCADDVRLDDKGNIYVTDSFENRVYKITPEFDKSIFIDSDVDKNELGYDWHITGITFDPEYNNLYISRMKDGQIVKYPIKNDGTLGNPEIIAELPEPDHLEVDQNGNLYVTLFREGSLVRIDKDGNFDFICNGEFGYATGIAFGKNEFHEKSVFIADYRRNIVYKVYVDSKGAQWKK